MCVYVCSTVCFIPVTTVTVIDFTELLPMKITLHCSLYEVRSVNFLKTFKNLGRDCSEVNMKQLNLVGIDSDR